VAVASAVESTTVLVKNGGEIPRVQQQPKKKKVLLLMSDTGGGHRASAQALAAALEGLEDPCVECEILDIWTEYAPWPYRNFVPYYAFLAKRPVLWRLLWTYAGFPLTRGVQEWFAFRQCYERFEDAIAERSPDLVVSVHPLTQSIPLRAVKNLDAKRGTKTPFVTVVTDLASAHPTWFHKDVDTCFVPSESVKELAKKRITLDRIVQHGLPLREAFWKPETRSKTELRTCLGLPHEKTALVVGGGDGVGGLTKLAKSIAKEFDEDDADQKKKPLLRRLATRLPKRRQKKRRESEVPASLVVVCGKNEAAKAELEEFDWPANVQATVLGFVKNMDEYMAAADLLVSKAGPGTIAEASTRGLPTLLSSYLPGQEAGNVKYVTTDKKFGDFQRRPKRIARTVKRWLQDEQVRTQLSHHATLAATLDATKNIASDIAAFLDDPFGDDDTTVVTAQS